MCCFSGKKPCPAEAKRGILQGPPASSSAKKEKGGKNEVCTSRGGVAPQCLFKERFRQGEKDRDPRPRTSHPRGDLISKKEGGSLSSAAVTGKAVVGWEAKKTEISNPCRGKERH